MLSIVKIKSISNIENVDYIRDNVRLNEGIKENLVDAINQAPTTALPFFGLEMVPSGKELFKRWQQRFYGDAYKTEQIQFINNITFEEWQERRLSNGKKLGKQLRYMEFSQELLDFDGSQERVDKNKYVIIFNPCWWSKLGMSSLAEKGSWDGFGGTSCQDIRNLDSSYSHHVLGSMMNDYYTIQLVRLNEGEKVSDFNSYQALDGRLIARVNAWSFDGRIRTNDIYYGSSKTKQILIDIIEQLQEQGLDIQEGDYGYDYQIDLNSYKMSYEEDILVSVDDYYTIDCPACGGSGTQTVWDERDNEHECDCPACGGSGEYELYICNEEWETVKSTKEILPYDEGIVSYNEVNVCNEEKGMTLGDWMMTVNK